MHSSGSGPGGSADTPGGPGKDIRQIARALIEAAFSGDTEGAIACCTPDLELRIEGIQTVRGHEGLQHIIEFNTEVSTNSQVEIHHMLAAGDTAAINRTTYLTIGGKEIVLEVGAFFEFRDGLVCRWVDYQDMGVVTRALGH